MSLSTFENKTLAFVGSGQMAEAMIAGLVHNHLILPEQIIASGPRSSRGEEAGRYKIRHTTDNREAVRDADLLIVVLDATDLIQTARLFDTTLFDGRNFVVALNKIDLLTPSQVEDLSACLSLPDDGVPLPISTVTGEGLKTLREIITDRVGLRILEPAQSVTITNVRHQEILLRCRDYLAKALESIESGTPPECVAVDLRGAADALGEITGAITSDGRSSIESFLSSASGNNW